jgi:hypothetical protein
MKALSQRSVGLRQQQKKIVFYSCGVIYITIIYRDKHNTVEKMRAVVVLTVVSLAVAFAEDGCLLYENVLRCTDAKAMQETPLTAARYLEVTGDALNWDVITQRFKNLVVSKANYKGKDYV